MIGIKLTHKEVSSELWEKIKKALNDELTLMREVNDSKELKHSRTQYIRGRIAIVKEFLEIEDED